MNEIKGVHAMRLKMLLPLIIATLLGQACIQLPELETPSNTDTTDSGNDPNGGGLPPKHPPELTETRQTSTSVAGGRTITFRIVAHDPQNSALGFSWEASAGVLGNQTSTSSYSEVTWTAPACGGAPSETTATITATVINTLGLSVTKSFNVKGTCYSPEITETRQSTVSVSDGAMVTLHLTTRDPQNSVLSFAWSSSAGSLGTPTSTAILSEVVWSAPVCGSSSPKETTVIITATVTNALGLSSSTNFNVTASCPKWMPTSPVRSVRLAHTATLLPSGKVLVTGGYMATSRYDSAELYDPATSTWSSTGSMLTARYGHTATLLPSGKVLITGGTDGSTYYSTAEVYDPSTGLWSSTSSMSYARARHTATLLPSGKVFVTGGFSGSISPTLTEIYDPTTGTWTSAGSMAYTYSSHTATLVSSDKVLIAGSGRSEVYNPTTNTWATTPAKMVSARSSHTATLLPSGKVLVAGGINNSTILASAEIYDPITGIWSSATSMAFVRQQHTATLLTSGKVLVVGGYDNGALATAEVYDPVADAWSSAINPSIGHFNHTATALLSGKVLITGGSMAEEYNP
ncbi:Kelch repeat-containing protein [Archangium sp.]|uniref:Kelch repeat-containing protein n=1 Tax=Archangium sp. TaxID=1872627 RepID=UPI002ED776EE